MKVIDNGTVTNPKGYKGTGLHIGIKKKNKDKLFERISSLMKLYFANDREGFVDALLSLELISKHLYDLIQKNSDKQLVKKIKRIKTGKDLNV